MGSWANLGSRKGGLDEGGSEDTGEQVLRERADQQWVTSEVGPCHLTTIGKTTL